MRSSPYEAIGSHPLRTIFGVLGWRQTYLNLLYLMLGFPLGVAYFVVFVTGSALGVGLIILLIGAVILLAVLLLAHWLGIFERELAVRVLGVSIAQTHTQWPEDDAIGRYLKGVLTNRTTWTGLLFLLARFPLGLASWIVAVVLITVTFGFVAAPVIHALGGNVEIWLWRPVTTEEFLLVSLIGLAMIVPVFHLLNGIAWLWGRFARLMLGGKPSTGPTAGAAARVPAGGESTLLPAV